MQFAVRIAGVFLTLLLTTASARADSPLESLLAAVRAAGGAPYTFHLRSTLSELVDGKPVESSLDIEGPRRLVRRCEGLVCFGLYSDGERTFATNLNDTALPAGPASPFDEAVQAALLETFADPAFRAGGGTLVLGERLERNGVAYFRLLVRPVRGEPVEVLIDPTSHFVASVEDPHHRVDFAYAAGRAGPAGLPSSIAWHGPEAREQQFGPWSIVSEPLSAPAGLVPAFGTSSVSTKMLSTGRATALPVVACTIDKRTVPCLLDTGNSGLSMSLELAESLGIEPTGGAYQIRGVGQYATGIALGPSFSIGAVNFPEAKFSVLHDIHRYGYDVILGADVFAHARITVDYPRGNVLIEPPSASTADPALPLTFENFVPVAQVSLGDTSVPLALDTGDESSINLSGDFYADHSGLFAPTASVPVAGIGGTSEELTGTIASVRVAGFSVARQTIGATKRLHATADGHLGSAFLAHFTVVFDYANARAELVPRAGDPAVSRIPEVAK